MSRPRLYHAPRFSSTPLLRRSGVLTHGAPSSVPIFAEAGHRRFRARLNFEGTWGPAGDPDRADQPADAIRDTKNLGLEAGVSSYFLSAPFCRDRDAGDGRR